MNQEQCSRIPADTAVEQENRRLLKERARLLAKAPLIGEDDGKRLAMVVFTLAREHYGVESHCIAEVVAVPSITPIPCTPEHVRGIVNLRGRIITVIDLKNIFGLDHTGQSNQHRLIILHSESMEFALLADTIRGVEEIALHKIQPAPPTLTDIRADYLKGVAEGQVAVLDGPKLLNAPWLIVDETVAPA